jgi:translocation and assembly module TamA
VLETEGRLVELWRQRGHPKASVQTRDVVADHQSQTVDVTLLVEPGPAAQFGAADVTGTERMNPGYVRWMTGIEAGAPYDPDDVRLARERLQRLGVFSSVAAAEGDTVRDDGLLPITFNVSERKRRLLGGGASYSTLEGAALEAYWMHRNLFGRAESLRFDAAVSRIGATDLQGLNYSAATDLPEARRHHAGHGHDAPARRKREFVDTYESRSVTAQAGLEHRFTEKLTGSTALSLERAYVEDAFGSNRYTIVSLPSELDYDGRDNKLDPTRGLRATANAEPLFEFEEGTTALVARGSVSGYFSPREGDRMVFAARGALGSIVGGELEDIPANRRFFLGGGGSIRGYEYRTVGPRVGDEVVGGLSFWEASLEARFRMTETIGIVPFIDAGAAYEDSIPDFGEGIRVGAGLGLRYYTGLGPSVSMSPCR